MAGGFESGFSEETSFDVIDAFLEAFLFFLEGVVVFFELVKAVLLAGGAETEK